MSSNFANEDPILSLTEAAERLGVTPQAILRWAESGKLHYVLSPGGLKKFRESAIKRINGDE